MARLVTIRDVARYAEVSVATVSRVLNNRGSINEEMRRRVLQVAADLGYSKPVSKNSGTRQNERLLKEVGFLLTYGDLDDETLIDSFWAYVLRGAATEAGKCHLAMKYLGINRLSREPQRLLTTLRKMHMGGLLLVGPAEPETVLTLQEAGYPLVLVDNYVHLPGCQVDAVLSANFEGTREAVSYLISEGHRRIAFLGGIAPVAADSPASRGIYTIERRKDGYLRALYDAGLEVPPALIEAGEVGTPELGYAACQRLLASGEPFSAIMCANDPVAIGTIKALLDAGLRVPEDVSVIGFDDIDIVRHLTPALTTVRVNKEAMGATAVKMLLARVNDPQAVCATVVLEVELVKRASVTAAPASFSPLFQRK